METSVVRQAVLSLLHHVKRSPADRRDNRRWQTDQASREFKTFLDRIAVPLFKQVSGILRAEGYEFDVFTPGDGVRLVARRGNDSYIEVVLDTKGVAPKLLGRVSHERGGNVTQTELVLNVMKDIDALTDADLLGFVLAELEPFVDK